MKVKMNKVRLTGNRFANNDSSQQHFTEKNSLSVIPGRALKCVQSGIDQEKTSDIIKVVINLWPNSWVRYFRKVVKLQSIFPLQAKAEPFQPLSCLPSPCCGTEGGPSKQERCSISLPYNQQVTGRDQPAGSSRAHSGCAVFCNLYRHFKGWSGRWEKKVSQPPFFFKELCWTTAQIKLWNKYPLQNNCRQCNCNN